MFDEYDELNNVVQENVNAARVVKAYVREDHEVEKFGKISGIVFRLFTKAEKIVAWNSPTMQFTMYLVVLAMVLIGGESIISGDMLTDTDISYDGIVCIRYDHDRGSVYGTYQRSFG